MTETQTTRVLPNEVKPPLPSSLADYATKIKEHLIIIAKANRDTVPRAMDIGDLLKQAKSQGGYGNWGRWLNDNCHLPERTAQLYMRLAKNRSKIEAVLSATSATVADLTLRGALQLLKGEGGGGKKGNPYDNAEKRLVESLLDLKLEEAKTKSNLTIDKLRDAVKEMEKIVKQNDKQAA